MTPPPNSPVTATTDWKSRVVSTIFYLAIVPAALVSAASFFGRFHWLLDLFSHFRIHYTGWLALCAILAICCKNRNAAALACTFTLLNLVPLAHYYPPPFPKSTPQGKLRVLSFNLLQDNLQHEKVAGWIDAQEADLILLQEFSPPWHKALKPLEEHYPHQYLNAGHWNFGFAIFSKFPLSNKKTLRPTTTRASCLTASVSIGTQEIELYVVHPVSPDNEAEFTARNDYLANLIPQIKKTRSPVIVAGDFNSSLFSPFLKKFLQTLDLENAAKGRGYHSTYESRYLFPGIPIDHILYSRELHCVGFRTGPPLGSDHRPIVADLTW